MRIFWEGRQNKRHHRPVQGHHFSIDDIALFMELTLFDHQHQSRVDDEYRSARKKSVGLKQSLSKLVQTKAASLWKDEIEAAGNNERCVLKTVVNILGDAESWTKSNFTPLDHCNFIERKTDDGHVETRHRDLALVDRQAPELSSLNLFYLHSIWW